MKKVFFRMKLTPSELGLQIWTDKYFSVHETPCYHFCIAEWQQGYTSARLDEGETQYQSLKRRGIKLKKIAKKNSRFAFETKEEAFENLVYLKKRQLLHLKRDVEFLSAFISFSKGGGLNDLDEIHNQLIVSGTKDLVLSHYAFD